MVLENIHTLHVRSNENQMKVRSNENLRVWESKRLKNKAKLDLSEGE